MFVDESDRLVSLPKSGRATRRSDSSISRRSFAKDLQQKSFVVTRKFGPIRLRQFLVRIIIHSSLRDLQKSRNATLMAGLEHLESLIREKVEKERWTHDRLSDFLQRAYPGVRGLSVRSLQRFCSEKGIHKTARISEQELDRVVADAVAKVNHALAKMQNHKYLYTIKKITVYNSVTSNYALVSVGIKRGGGV